MTTERIDIIVSERGSRVVKRNLEDIGGGATRAARGVQFLRQALVGLGSALLLRELSQMADTYTLITNRLRLVTSGTQNLADINDRLFASAQRTRTSYEATVDLYARIARNAGQLGLSQQRLLDITESVNQAIRISGGTSQEAAAGVRQFGQAIGSGALRGDELISVLENMPRLAQAIADGMGVSIGQLRALGADGALTADKIIAALEKTAPDIAREFEQLTPTIGEAFTVLNNSVLRFVGELDQALGISQAFSRALIFLAEHLETIAKLAAIAGVALSAAFAASLIGRVAGTISQVIALERALGAASASSALFSAALKIAQRGMLLLNAAMLANPIGLVIGLIAALVSALFFFRDEIKVTADGVVSLGDVFRAVFSLIGEYIAPVVTFFKDAWNNGLDVVGEKVGGLVEVFTSVLSAVLGFVKTVVNTQIGIWVGAFRTIVGVWNLLPAAFEALGAAAVNGLLSVIDSAISGIVQGVGNLLEFIGSAGELVGLSNPFAGLFDNFESGLDRFRIEGAPAVGDVFGQMGSIAANAFSESLNTDYIGTLVDTVLGRAREIAEARAAQRAAGGTDPGLGDAPNLPGSGAAGAGAAGAAAELSDQMQRMKDLLEDIRGPMVDYQADLQALDTLLASGAITAQEYADKWRDIRIAFLDTQTTFAAGLERGLLKVQQDLNDMASDIERVFTNAFKSAEDALTEFIQTGKLDFRGFVNSILEDLIRLSVRQTILKPLANALGGFLGFDTSGLFGGAAGGDNGAAALNGSATQLNLAATSLQGAAASLAAGGGIGGNLAGALTQGTQAAAQATQAASTAAGSVNQLPGIFGSFQGGLAGIFGNLQGGLGGLFSSLGQSLGGLFSNFLGGFGNLLSSLFSGGGGGGLGGLFGSLLGGIFGGGIGFATGGGFNVGGSGGVDSQLVQFRASPGERVEVKRPGDQSEGGGQRQQFVFNITTPDAESFRRSESQIAARLARAAQRGRRNL